MIELGQLEREHEKFKSRQTRVVVVSIEDEEKATQTQAQFPHLVVVADADQKLTEAIGAVHKQSTPEGADSAAPTTLLIDGAGQVRWTFRPDRVFRRLSPEEVLAAIDKHLPRR